MPTSVKKFIVRTPTTHDFTKAPVIEGVIQKFDALTQGKNKRPYMVIDTGVALEIVYQSKALDDVFAKGKTGMHVRLELVRVKPLAGGKTFKDLSVALWTE